ncbi:DUF1883 domain-containing protein [Desulfovibrio sp. JC022]|uniref:DUF1883 domain-containing protein n=1 Tax=Desulfovibrio sp. JC022 TaxID=2593642 RepID=UPI0013D64A20|nr:DUF1883 domain-containing protein [Desulfovibrio sp. JC022]NDV24717.1 DUF1883 domain-containing protein [Desulfovibrio sp. JC022]
MNFIQFDMGHLSKGQIVEVSLTSGANVRLMDGPNFNSYKNGRKHTYYGGLAKKSPTRIQVPRTGRWYVAVDMQGLRGSTKASARVLPSPLPEIREQSLSDIPSLVRNNIPPSAILTNEVHDVFISHASEDKDEIVRPLATALINEGLNVWYDEFTLRIGDSLRQKIDKGLACSVALPYISPSAK